MISVARTGRGMVKYLTDKTRKNYYLDGGEPPGQWVDLPASHHFRVAGDIRREHLHSLTLGFDIDGGKLVQNAGKLDGTRPRHLGISYVFNADKNFSIEWALSPPKRRKKMEAAFARAVERCIREYIEPEIARCRLRDGTEVQARILAAMFIHATSREGDMHYHAHVLFPNLGLCPDENTRALVSKLFYDHKLDAGAYFRLALEQECWDLGIEFHRPLDAKGEQKQFTEAKGIPENVRRHFSKRRAQIDQQLDSKGLASAAAAAVATLQTRHGKEVVPPRAELLARWRKEAISIGFSPDSLIRPLCVRKEIDNFKEYSCAVRAATQECTQREGHFQRKDIFRETLVAAQGRGGVDPFQLRTCLNHDLSHSPTFVNLGIRNKIQRFTVPEVLQAEQEMLQDVQDLHIATLKPLPETIVQRAAQKERRLHPSQATTPAGKFYDALRGDKRTYTLDEEQQACLRYATQSPGRIKAIYGLAGSTKTTVTAAIAEAYRDAGFKLYGTALAGVAAKGLAEKTGIQSDTLQMTLMRLYPKVDSLAKHHVQQLWRAARGLPTYKFDRLKLDRHAVVFVDEASMIGTRDFALLTKACNSSGATMVVIGDTKQLPALQQGGAFGSIIDRVGGFELTTIKRQESKEERDRVKQLYRGETEAVITSYARDGKIHVARTHADAMKELIRSWADGGGISAPKDHAIFAATNFEIRSLNDMAQQERLNAGEIKPYGSIKIGEEQFYSGDRVLFTKKSRTLRVENGDTGTIVGIRNNPLSAAVKVLFDGDNRPREVTLRTLHKTHYDGITRNYAMTVHKMQGRTVDHSYCSLMGAMTDRELTYVALSRHRKSVQIVTDENHAGVALTNIAREATGNVTKIRAKPGLKEEYSPLITQAKKSNAKTLATDQKKTPDLTIKLEPEV